MVPVGALVGYMASPTNGTASPELEHPLYFNKGENMNKPKVNYHAIRIGWYSDKYFLRTQEILMKDEYINNVHYQYFPRKDCVVCGIEHVLDLFKECTGYYKDREKAWKLFQDMQDIDIYNCDITSLKKFYDLRCELDILWQSKYDELDIWARKDGDEIKDMEPVIGVIGNPKYFAHLETPTLGVLAQMSAVATSVRRATSILNKDQSLLFFPARFKHYVSQAPDGASAVVGGIKSLSTDANGEYWGYSGIGTIPHLLIAAYWGDTAKAALKFDEIIDPSVNRVILVDWDNDCIGTTIRTVAAYLQNYLREGSQMVNIKSVQDCKRFLRDYRQYIYHVIGSGKGKVFAVRFDTSGSLIDKSLSPHQLFGVNYPLVKLARDTFDELGLGDLKIVVSGGFDEEKLKLFKRADAPYDMVGIGSSIVNKFTVDFTADAVMLNGQVNAKVGRELMDWGAMTEIKRKKEDGEKEGFNS